MPIVRCNARTCKYYRDEECTAPIVLLEDKEFEATDEIVCTSYEYNPGWYRAQIDNENLIQEAKL